MTTNLVYAYPDIPFAATSHTLTGKGADASYSKSNVVNAYRSDRFQFDTTSSTPEHTFALASGQTAEYLIVSQADLTIQGGSTAIYLGGKNGGGYTYPVNGVSWTASSLVGFDSEDYIVEFTETASYTTWLVQLHGSASTSVFPHGQIYFGKFFDFGRDPLYGRTALQDTIDASSKTLTAKYFFQYEGITDAKKIEFETKIGKYKEVHPVFLYTRTEHNPLLGRRLAQCVLLNYAFTATAYNINSLEISFQELY